MRSISRTSIDGHTKPALRNPEDWESGSDPRPHGGPHNLRRSLVGWVLATLLFAWTGAAQAYTLAELIDDQTSFSSLNETVVFSDFTLLSSGIDPGFLELYEVIPNRFGFWVFSPDYGLADPSELGFSYQVEAAAGLNISSVAQSLSRLEDADMDATSEMWVENLSGSLLAELEVAIQNGAIPGCKLPCWRRYDSDWISISATNKLQISEFIGSGVIPPAEWKLSQKYFTEPVPEPSTALLIGLGLAGIAFRRRSRVH